ncbi:MAG: TetR/AcrR family transcriptional regulator [Thermoleophilaceae bacterium]|nr:TetR/AcrR family transcriptional regulator [Thermoleophilaceae bacterium]
MTGGERTAATPLPRGRHKLPREAVLASQRARLLEAMSELVGRQGYEATTVPDVVAAARVSRNAFYDLFSDKTDCFIALCEDAGHELATELVAFVNEGDWRVALREGLRTYLRWWQERPALARAYLVELPMAGPRAIVQRERQYDRFGGVLQAVGQWARLDRTDLPELRSVSVRAAVISVTELVAAQVREAGPDRLLELEDDLYHLLVTLLAGPPAD